MSNDKEGGRADFGGGEVDRRHSHLFTDVEVMAEIGPGREDGASEEGDQLDPRSSTPPTLCNSNPDGV